MSAPARPRIAIVSRETFPFEGGGISFVATLAARELAEVADVALFTRAAFRDSYESMEEARRRELFGGCSLVWVPETELDDVGNFLHHMHAASARVYDALKEHYGDRGPDLIEFNDYLAEGFVSVQARHTRDRFLSRTRIATRIQTTSEICSVLDGSVDPSFTGRALYEMERYCLRYSDTVIAPCEESAAMYRRYYGVAGVAPITQIPTAWLNEQDVVMRQPAARDGHLRLLYLGRFERRKGVQNLIRAIRHLDHTNWTLSMLGGDTPTAPLRTSLGDQLRTMAGGDPQIEWLEPVPREQLPHLIAEHDVIVLPSLWENWPNVAFEAFAQNRPILGTPVGGLAEMIRDGENGWLADGVGPEALRRALNRIIGEPEAAMEMIRAGTPARSLERLAPTLEGFQAAYLDLCRAPLPSRPARRARKPLVTVVVPYFRLDRYVTQTVRSALAQTHDRLEVIVVNDGSLREQDRVLEELAEDRRVHVITSVNSGLSSARNLGISAGRGRYVVPLDADDVMAPQFVERCLEALTGDARLAYCTTWVNYMDEDGIVDRGSYGTGYLPWGNWSPLVRENNIAGTCTALFPRVLFDEGLAYSPDLASFEDWMLYRSLHRAGRFGHVIPERLISYRIRDASMMREYGVPQKELVLAEMEAHEQEGAVQWQKSA